MVGHGSEARAELRVSAADGQEQRWQLTELGALRLVETAALVAAQMRRQKAPLES